ncbi:MAG: SDR family oxidoreductase [Paracoccaceae bacterium]
MGGRSIRSQAPLDPEDIAEAVLYLCAGAGMVTGHVLVVDGGMTFDPARRRISKFDSYSKSLCDRVSCD